ncbi:ATP-dependent protease (plasmid) [Pseudoalteromonas lipolytica]|jgi:Lon protease-like protein|uniref:ATP-dependent protease n=1 Tax=Pseudoalteromonas lipolytica TaxID=570156 RepID=A0AAD0S2K8_9GAMM|nr:MULTISPECIES: LON peptidase substrate-binding domain-containing protein [Pseudoalteromonas]AXV66993.1 ATP-dependent protease [Pseudoalteromonas donghaensis]EWH05189.1 ATP-dependent protease [Pseudoalteromonas lipolytica SCSIO 04301]MCC9661996.1 LON peptidase substrate-binding domain-containing protein [Pseudoalteromonas sp. MB41]
MKRAIFPLPVFILPEGYTKLRIFEQRYLTMVKEAVKDNTGFVLCTYQHDTELNLPEFGCMMQITDFNQDDSGQLLIDVYAEHAVSINQPFYDKQALRHADVERVSKPSWYVKSVVTDENLLLSHTLQAVFANQPDLAALYKAPQFDNLAWVAARWLEILPISLVKKQQLAFKSNFENLLSFLHTLINTEFTD